MKRCKTCKWWQAENEDDRGPKQCRYPYDEDLWLDAGPELGCVHHEERTEGET